MPTSGTVEPNQIIKKRKKIKNRKHPVDRDHGYKKSIVKLLETIGAHVISITNFSYLDEKLSCSGPTFLKKFSLGYEVI